MSEWPLNRLANSVISRVAAIAFDAWQTRLREAAAPQTDRFHARVELTGDVFVELARRGREHDLGPQHQPS